MTKLRNLERRKGGKNQIISINQKSNSEFFARSRLNKQLEICLTQKKHEYLIEFEELKSVIKDDRKKCLIWYLHTLWMYTIVFIYTCNIYIFIYIYMHKYIYPFTPYQQLC